MSAGADIDRADIVNVLNLYAGALDSHGWDLFAAIFTEDVEADYPGSLHWWDLATFRSDFAKYHEALEGHQHVMTNHQAVIDGDGANSLTYGRFRLFERTAASQIELREGACWYDDTFIRTQAGWRIRKRVARVFWTSGAKPQRAVLPDGAVEPSVSGAGSADSLSVAAKAGEVAYFNALRRLASA